MITMHWSRLSATTLCSTTYQNACDNHGEISSQYLVQRIVGEVTPPFSFVRVNLVQGAMAVGMQWRGRRAFVRSVHRFTRLYVGQA